MNGSNLLCLLKLGPPTGLRSRSGLDRTPSPSWKHHNSVVQSGQFRTGDRTRQLLRAAHSLTPFHSVGIGRRKMRYFQERRYRPF